MTATNCPTKPALDSERQDLAVHLTYLLTRTLVFESRMDEQHAARLAEAQARALLREYAGERLDIPSARAQAKAARDDAIRREWNGRNARELMRRHGVSRSVLYEVLKG